jgi:hypothetical protein
MTSILAVLCLSANTSFADFPRLCRAVAKDGYLPNSFTNQGRRLVYAEGIWLLAILSGLLLLVFNSVTDRLIPLFAVGAFLAFTLSQSGMVAHWWKSQERGARASMVVNGLGAVATAIYGSDRGGRQVHDWRFDSRTAGAVAGRPDARGRPPLSKVRARNCVAGQSAAREFARTYRDSADHSVEFDREERLAARYDTVTRGRSPAYRK